MGEGNMIEKFDAKHVILGGGDNGKALVQLACGLGHLNVTIRDMKYHEVEEAWMLELEELKALLPLYFDACSISENFSQWTKTVVLNLYSASPKTELNEGIVEGKAAEAVTI